MSRSAYVLAALASAALPDLDVCAVRLCEPTEEFDLAEVQAVDGTRFEVRAPRTPRAQAEQAAELEVLADLARARAAGQLPFDVPQAAGLALLDGGGRVVVQVPLPGTELTLDQLHPGPGLAANLGRTIAAIHELPTAFAENAGLPIYDATAYRERHLAELDEVARTGRIPVELLRRWERALEDVSLWRFQPVFVHGDLAADLIRVSGSQVTAIAGWASARVADPADDLAWLLAAAPEAAMDSIMEAYQLRRTESPDLRLAERALLLGELAVARWLHFGVTQQRPEVVTDAEAMLADLVEATAEDA